MNMSFKNDNKNIFTDRPVKNGKPLVIDINLFPILGEQKTEEKTVINYRTKPCRNVTNNKGRSSPGICYRKKCTFAHSIVEWRVPECRYDQNCRYFYGKYNNFGNVIKGSVCRFKHSCENVDEWLYRTNQKNPNLPLYTVTTTTTKQECDKFVNNYEDNEKVENTKDIED